MSGVGFAARLVLAALLAGGLLDDLRSDDPQIRRDAYKAIEALTGDDRVKALEGFVKLQQQRHREFEREWKRLHDNFLGYGERGEQGTIEFLAEWLAARDAAVEIVFDERRYPFPPGGRASGPMRGHEIVRPRLDAAKKAFEPILPLAKSAASTALRGGWSRNLEKLKAQAVVIREADAALARAQEGWTALSIGSFDFLDAMERIGRQEFKESVEIYGKGGLTRAQKILYFLVYGAVIENYNLNKIRTKMSGTDKQAVTALNEYRMALGVLPYEHDPQLTDAIKGHINDIASGRTEYGHMSTVKGKRSPQDRVRLAGWSGGAGENLAAMGPMRAVEAWFWDGGHGRNNVSPHFDKIGFASGGVSGFNNGSGGDCVLPRFKPPFSYGGSDQ
jgi:hypothetical protein